MRLDRSTALSINLARISLYRFPGLGISTTGQYLHLCPIGSWLQPFMKGSQCPDPFPSKLFVCALDGLIVDVRRTFQPKRMPLHHLHTRPRQGCKKPLSGEIRMYSGNAVMSESDIVPN